MCPSVVCRCSPILCTLCSGNTTLAVNTKSNGIRSAAPRALRVDTFPLQAALATLDYRNVNAQSVVVLRRRDDTHRKYLHTGILAVTIGVCVYRIYELLN
jgi:hypothetical protein